MLEIVHSTKKEMKREREREKERERDRERGREREGERGRERERDSTHGCEVLIYVDFESRCPPISNPCKNATGKSTPELKT